MLGLRDRRTGMYGAHAVPFKGAGTDWIAQQVARDIVKCGYHGRVVLRADGEPALQDLLNAVARVRGDLPTVLETSPPGESQSNGYIERAVRSLEDMIRTHKLDLEARMGEKVEVTGNIMAWLIEHSADILNKFQVGRDGRTPYERLKGKRFRGLVYEFASPCMLRVSGKPQGGLMQARWVEGVWIGSRFNSQEHLVARNADGVVVRTRAVREVPRGVTLRDLDRVVGTPHAPTGVQDYRRPERAAEVPPARQVAEPPQRPDAGLESRPVPRSVYITKEFRDTFGYTPTCARCRSVQRNESSTMRHTKECRARIEELLKSDETHQRKLQEAEDRKTTFLAEELKQEQERRDRAKGGGGATPAHRRQRRRQQRAVAAGGVLCLRQGQPPRMPPSPVRRWRRLSVRSRGEE